MLKYQVDTGFFLEWDEQLGYGRLELPNTEQVYDKAYWDKYQALKDTPMGKQLTKARIDLVKKYVTNPSDVIDIGIGNGQFVEEYGCWGTDVNPHAIEWLKSVGKYSEYNEDYGHKWFTYWDVFEHLSDELIADMIAHNHEGIIMSMPIYESFNHCTESKHLRPTEHCLYFTVHGLIHFMDERGYDFIEYGTEETKIGREDIGSFVFKKRK